MSKIYFTLTGTNHYSENDFLKKRNEDPLRKRTRQ